MDEERRRKNNAEKLDELFPTFRDRIGVVVTELESHGFRPRIQEAWRSEEDQLKAFNANVSLLKFGFHNVTAANGTKEALAVDIVDDDLVNGVPVEYTQTEFFLWLAAEAQKQGLVSGIRWGLLKLEPESLAAAAIAGIDNAIANGDWKAIFEKLGWDPSHIQPPDITPEDARNGQRPL